MRLTSTIVIAIGALATASVPRRPNSEAKVVEVQHIWDRAPHNAFTDLLHRDGRWYCVFREGQKHVSPDGALRVITSPDGRRWEPLALIEYPSADLRDAKISTAPDGVHYERHIEQVNVPNGVGEDKLLFLDDSSALCLLRHQTGPKTALLGKSASPYEQWTWKDLGKRIGGPNMIQLGDGRIVAASK